MSDKFAEVREVLHTYFDALYTCDLALFEAVFHPRALYATADEAPALFRSMEEYFPVIAKRVSPQSRGEPRRDVIDSIEFAGDNTALAKVRCSIGERDFLDFLTLVRENGRWQIAAKIFHIKPKSEG
ncbi:Putative lumazine-binding [Roseovarius azorensis]|uniref:Putative lumazine-binding n=1 Tax=Roseovarius azorensis TaxID=1287727 RepID=A0A1H7IV67_9RHOB|nr:nuclear transport factor 2 family protein [Roseovarius azorensis]SEK65597.1 Putative lumazine-binding [Roseovarius azorensis]